MLSKSRLKQVDGPLNIIAFRRTLLLVRNVGQVDIFVTLSRPAHPSVLGPNLAVENGVAGINLFFIGRELIGILIVPICLSLHLALTRDGTNQWFMRVRSRARADPSQLVLTQLL